MPDPWERPPIATSPVSVLLLAHDAADDLDEVVRAWAAQLQPLERPFELILVDDGSTDETRTRAEALASGLPQLRVLAHDSRQGLGAALRTGIAAAQHPLLLWTTCDRQYEPADLKKMLEHIDRVDVATGIRPGRRAPLWLRMLNAVYRGFARVFVGVPLPRLPSWHGWAWWRRRWVAHWLFGVRIHDPECVFRLFRRSVFDRLPIQSDSDFALVEVLAKANFTSCIMGELEVTHRPLPSGAALHKDGKPGPRRGEVGKLFRDPTFHPPPTDEKPPDGSTPDGPTNTDITNKE